MFAFNFIISDLQAFVVQTESEPSATVTEEVSLEPSREEGEFTTILYQEQVEDPGNPFYTETIVTGSLMCGPRGAQEEVKEPPLRIKNKRTVAAVSSEDKRLALNAMEELRSRGATTDDLICRLCDPARPFTAYSTLLTHYRSDLTLLRAESLTGLLVFSGVTPASDHSSARCAGRPSPGSTV